MFSFSGIPHSQSEMVQKAVEMGIEASVVEKSILEKMNRTGSGYSSMEALVEDCLRNTTASETAKEQGSNVARF